MSYRGLRRRRITTVAIERTVTIRFAFPDDAEALERLAILDSRCVPSAPVLLGEVDGELWASLSLADGEAAADPFRPAAGVVELLAARARQLGDQDMARGARPGVLAPAMPAG